MRSFQWSLCVCVRSMAWTQPSGWPASFSRAARSFGPRPASRRTPAPPDWIRVALPPEPEARAVYRKVMPCALWMGKRGGRSEYLSRGVVGGTMGVAGPCGAQRGGERGSPPRQRRLLEFLVQPGAGVGPMPVGAAHGDAEGVGRLLDGQAGEVAQLDQLGNFRLLLGEPLDRLAHGQQAFIRLLTPE